VFLHKYINMLFPLGRKLLSCKFYVCIEWLQRGGEWCWRHHDYCYRYHFFWSNSGNFKFFSKLIGNEYMVDEIV